MAQAMSIAGVGSQLNRFDISNIPVGKALILSGGMGVVDGLKGLLERFIPPLWTGAALGIGIMVVPQVKQFLGVPMAELLSAGLIADAINDQVDLRGRVRGWLDGLLGGQAQRYLGTPSIVQQAERVADRAGDHYASAFRRTA